MRCLQRKKTASTQRPPGSSPRPLRTGCFLALLLILGALPPAALAQRPVPPALLPDPASTLQTYRASLAKLRQEHLNHHELPDLKFFLFGMGDRLKLVYRNGRLLNALTGNIEEQWTVKKEIIVPSAYTVHLELAAESRTPARSVQIREDETGVWILQPGKRPRLIPGTRSRLALPDFAGQPYAPVLRVLHQEILVNVINGRPVPNFLVYLKPGYRDAAQMAMVLRETGNLPLIRDWIMNLRAPFDHNNHGPNEADNPGQVLFLVSLVADKNHPVVPVVLDSVRQFRQGDYTPGRTDKAAHPVYQTKWLKFGLKSLGLPDSYVIPRQYDSYSSLFWWDYQQEHVPASTAEKRLTGKTLEQYPYLAWAEDHFYGEKRGPVGSLDYPLSWERNATEAHYPGLTVLDQSIVKQKIAFPHARHAAEMFLLLMQKP